MYLRLAGITKRQRKLSAKAPARAPKPPPKPTRKPLPMSRFDKDLLAIITERQLDRWRDVLDEFNLTKAP